MSKIKTISPFQFAGNKKKAINNGLIDILEESGKDHLVDMMTGSGVVALNWDGYSYMNDADPVIVGLHDYIRHNVKEVIHNDVLSYMRSFDFTNEIAYYQLRRSYNHSHDPALLLILIQIGFNSLMRFNSRGEFNVPFGHNKKTFNLDRILNTLEHYKKVIHVYNESVFDFDYDLFNPEGFVLYFDPPYHFSKYNYGVWDIEIEMDFWDLIVELSDEGYKIAVSNVAVYRGEINEFLMDTCSEAELNIRPIGKVKYDNWSHAVSTVEKSNGTQEVVVTNY